MKFPFIGSAVLFSLFLVFKVLPKELVNAVLTAYFVLLGTFAITATLLPFIEVFFSSSVQDKTYELAKLRVPYFMKVPPEQLLWCELAQCHALSACQSSGTPASWHHACKSSAGLTAS